MVLSTAPFEIASFGVVIAVCCFLGFCFMEGDTALKMLNYNNGSGPSSKWDTSMCTILAVVAFVAVVVACAVSVLLMQARKEIKRITGLAKKEVFSPDIPTSLLQFCELERDELHRTRSDEDGGGFGPQRSNTTSCELRSFAKVFSAMELVQDSPSLRSIIGDLAKWDFDMIDFAETSKNPLVVVGFSTLETFKTVEVDKMKLLSFLSEIESTYKNVPYHNKLHGAAVARSAFAMCKDLGLEQKLPELMQFALVLAGIIHDVGHPGLTSSFLAKAGHELSIRYSDDSPLERMHLAIFFQFLRKSNNGFLKNEDIALVKRPIVHAVLGTDIVRHGEHMQRLNALIDNLEHSGSDGSIPWYWPAKPPKDGQVEWEQTHLQEFVLEVFLHAADIASPAMPFEQFSKWNQRVCDEFHAQGDRELAEFGHLISVPDGYDRNIGAARRHKFTEGFVKFIVHPIYTKLDELSKIDAEGNCVNGVNMTTCLEHLGSTIRILGETAPKE